MTFERVPNTTAAAQVPLLSVCMPTYRRPGLLRRALSSVIEQPGFAEEVEIVVADNSPELNRETCESLLASWRGPSRYLPNPTNIGAIPNFNHAARAASGRYLLFLHDDDRLLPGSLASMIDTLTGQRGGAVAYVFGVHVVDERGRVRRAQVVPDYRLLPPGAALRHVLSDSAFVRMPGLVISRRAFVDAGGFDESVGNPTDLDLTIRIFSTYGVTCVPGVTAQYTTHPAAATSSMFTPATIATLMAVFDRVAAKGDPLPANQVRRAQVAFFDQFILAGAYRALRTGRVRDGRIVLSLFDLPEVRRLGRSRRWALVRSLLTGITRLPESISGPILVSLGRLRLERLWHPR